MFLVIVGIAILLILLVVLAVYLVAKSRQARATADETKQATKW
jgi:uncharacterized protein YoxC